ncbi:MAG: Flp pilus assembly complex ATPase component TadA [Desulfobulbaceae bacterium]|nr:Flp pilus assembly complex ATPase component TadA [Desulfobulbaceae bacterium]
MFTIIIHDNKGQELDTLQCAGSSCSIGRSGKNLVQLKGWRIAGTHAELEEHGDGIFITDTSSGIGTRVNGDTITTFGPLLPHDLIGIGAYRISIAVDSKNSQPVHPAIAPEKDIDEDTVEKSAEPPSKQDEGRSLRKSYGVRQSHEEEFSAPAEKKHSFIWHKRIHEKLMNAMDLRRTDVESMNDDELAETIKSLVSQIIKEMDKDLPADIDRAKLTKEVIDEAIGLGPLEDFLADDSITEIMVNRYNDIYYEAQGKLHRSNITFSSDDAVLSVIERIVSPLGRRIDESSPMVDGRLKDGSRVNAIIPPLSIKGPCLTIRKFSKKKLTTEDFIQFGSISPAMVTFLDTAVRYRKNIIISGGTGSGKTTFLNVLSNFIPHTERIITVEDSAELKLGQPHVVSLEARPPNMEGKGAIVIRDLVKNCLRMRPDRIVVGECRGGETLDMLQAMNTGHDGSLTTVHANSPRDLISRLEVMVMMAGMELPEKAIREQISSAVHVIVQQSRFSDGTRKITHISEITGMETGVVQMQNIFVFKQRGLDENGRVLGEFKATGRVPEFYEELKQRGLPLEMSIFE